MKTFLLYLYKWGNLLDLVPGTLGAKVHESPKEDRQRVLGVTQRLFGGPGLALGRHNAQGCNIVQPEVRTGEQNFLSNG